LNHGTPGLEIGGVAGIERDQRVVLPLGIVIEPDDPMPGGFQSRATSIGALKSGLPLGDHLEVHRAPPDKRDLGLDDLDRERGFLGHDHGETDPRPGSRTARCSGR